MEPNIIHMYTDGACSENPGLAGIGVYIYYNGHEKNISEGIGIATNNVAELRAIKTGLEALTQRDKPVVIYSDSMYCIGILSKGWNAKANQELVAEIRVLVASFTDLKFVKVKGHSDNVGNNKADELAVAGKKADPIKDLGVGA